MTSNQFRVTVVEFGARRHFQMQYRDPMTRKKRTRATNVVRDGTKKARREAERQAGEWEKELREGTYQPPCRITWEDFRERYENEVLPSLAAETGRVVFTVFNTVEKFLSPERLADLAAERLSFLQSQLRAGHRSEATIKTYLKHLRSSLKWAKKMKMLAEVPAIELPKRAKDSKVMKGRPITAEEFERMLAKVGDVVAPTKDEEPRPGDAPAPERAPEDIERDKRIVDAWDFYLRGLWTSGLRLEESLDLFWDRHGKLRVDLDGKRPLVRIPAALQKSNDDDVLPLAPEFAQLLAGVPAAERKGRVFKLIDREGNPREFGDDWVGRVISAIGKKAGVKVDQRQKGDTTIVKYASAHDLRRAFGTRWALRVVPKVLMRMMRHKSIDTTMKYYVDVEAQTMADEIWSAFERGNTSGNTPSPAPSSAANKPAATSSHDGAF